MTRQLSILFGAAIIVCALFFNLNATAAAQQALPAAGADFNHTILVDTTTDPAGTNSTSCTYEGNGVRPDDDGLCSLRRAIIEAGALPLEQRPVLIAFNLPADEANAHVPGTWTIDAGAGLPAVKSLSAVTEPDSMVTIDGSTQPDGRGDGPVVFVRMDGPLALNRGGNTIRGMGFYGGGALILSRASTRDRQGENLIEENWFGLQEDGQAIVLKNEDVPGQLAGGGIMVQQSDGNVIRNNVITGASGRAVTILDGEFNEVSNNHIGTRGDGTVPLLDDAVRCRRSLIFDPAGWYGGWGIQSSGADNQIVNNIIAGLHQPQSDGETPPMAIEIVNGANILVQGNTIGVDAEGKEVGVCGIGISALGKSSAVSGRTIKLLENTIVASRQGFDESASDTAIYLGGASGITVRGNIIRNATTWAVNFSDGATRAWANFEPARITSVQNETVRGVSGAGSACPGCIIDLYVDDPDAKEEALTWAATTQADADGNWSVTLSQPLGDAAYLRTQSTSTAIGVIGNLDAGTSTRLSDIQSDNTVYLPIILGGS